YVDMYKLPREVVKPGCSLIELLRCRQVHGGLDRDPEQFRNEILTGIRENSGAKFAVETADGRTISVANRGMADGGWVATHEDVTERRRAEAEIAYLARHDTLTGLPNRRLFNEQLGEMLVRCKGDDSVAVMCLDVDRFKSVNDTLGHPIGDMLLKIAAER